MSAQWLSRRQFAEAEGCDEKQVRRGLESGRLWARADGKLDAAQVGSAWRRLRVDSRDPPARKAPPAAPQQAEQQPVSLTAAEVLRRLRLLDYTAEPDWSPAAQHQRVLQAARCVGLTALQSDLRDDGHHGGFQLRHADGEILAGYGFELESWQAVLEARQWATGLHQWGGPALFGPDTPAGVMLDLLPALALPVVQGELRRDPKPDGKAYSGRVGYAVLARAAGRF